MNINVICIGKLKEKYWQEAVREYSKRLGSYCSLQIIELKESLLRNNASAADELAVKQAEGREILTRIREGDYVITLEIKGKAFSSEHLAEHLEHLTIDGRSSDVEAVHAVPFGKELLGDGAADAA